MTFFCSVKPLSGLGFVLFMMTAGLLFTACEGLAGEPRIVATIPEPTAMPTLDDLGYPQAKPDIVLGAQLFAANCIRCHGSGGAGDGELVLNGQVTNPGNFTDAAAVQDQTPQDYFNTITYGNLENLMPPWGNTLTEEERWAVTAYVYTLHYSDAQLATGEAIYTTECSRCHGEEGRGDGPDQREGARTVDTLAKPREMIYLSDNNIFNMVNEGAGEDMPAYHDDLTVDEIYAVAAYTRDLWINRAAAVAQAQPEAEITAELEATLEIQPDGAAGRVFGMIINGTEGASVPANQIVTLHVVDTDLNEQTTDTSINADGSYSFDQVPLNTGAVYFISSSYNGRSFASPPFTIDPAQPEVETPLVIYEMTDDASSIQMSAIIMQISQVGDVLQITQEVQFNNTSDRMFVTEDPLKPGTFTSVKVSLPIGAIFPEAQNSERLVFDNDTFAIADSRAVPPGSAYVMQFVYLLPYQGSAIIDFPVDYPFSGAIIIIVDGEDLSLTGDTFIAVDPSVVPTMQGKAYGANLTLDTGDTIQFELTGGSAGVGTSVDSSVVTADNLLPIFAGFAALLIGGGAALFYLSRRTTQKKSTSDNDKRIGILVQKIAALDAQHNAGSINHDVYRIERAALDAELQTLLNTTESTESSL